LLRCSKPDFERIRPAPGARALTIKVEKMAEQIKNLKNHDWIYVAVFAILLVIGILTS